MQQVMLAALRRHHDAMAIVGQHRSLSYHQLEELSGRYAEHLAAAGVGPGDHVGLLLPRCPELVVAMVACWRRGAAYVPVDVNNPAERTARILQVSQPKVVVTRPGLADKLPTDTATLMTDALEVAIAPRSTWLETPQGGSAYVLFTSGSTGLPKGVAVGSNGLKRLLIDNPWADFSSGAQWLQVTSPAFDISNVELWGCLLHGGTLHLVENPLPSLDELADTLLSRRITHAQLSTAVFNALVDARPDGLKHLQQMISGGERASPAHMLKALSVNPALALINGYGPTETTIYSLTHRVTPACCQNPAGIPIGLPVLGTTIRLDDMVGGFERPDTGELLIGGDGLAHGYLGDPEQTARRFVTIDGQRWYRTGDLARRRADGLCEYLGRIDRQVKLQGQRIEIDEVELALGQCPGVGEVAILLRDQDPHNKHLAAFYSGLAEQAPDVDAVLAHLASCLLPAAIPKVIRPMDRLPVNLNGKVDRQALAALLDAPGPAQPPTSSPAAWRTPLESQLAALWSARLGGSPLTPASHFLRSGGTSLTALHLSADIRTHLGRIVSPAALLQHPVLGDQAQMVADAERANEAPEAAGSFAGNCTPYALTRGQAALLAASVLDTTGYAYLVHVPLWMDAPIEVEAWQRALHALAERHPLLRLQGHHDGQQACATIQAQLPPGWWQTHPGSHARPDDLHWPTPLTDVLNRPMPTEQGMFRVDHWPHMADGNTLLVLTFHHAIVDDAAAELLLSELDTLLSGHALPTPTAREASLARLEQELTQLEDLQSWAVRLASQLDTGALPPLPAPPALGNETGFTLPEGTWSALKVACKTAGCTPFPVLLTAYGHAIQSVFGPAYGFISTPFSRKSDHALQQTFAYLLDVRFIEAGQRHNEAGLLDTFDRVAAETLSAQRPQFQPLDALTQAVEALSPSAAQALTQFGFTWRHQALGHRRLGRTTAQLLRVPQSSAKYALCLHVIEQGESLLCSVEAVADAHEHGRVAQVQRAFTQALGVLIEALTQRPPRDTTTPALPDVGRHGQYLDAIRSAWNVSLSLPPDTHQALGEHYLRQGGTSLSAMRLTAELRKLHGLKIDLVEFLEHPTLGHLLQLATPQRPDCVLVGPKQAERVLLLIPGLGGHAVGLLRLAEAIQPCLPAHTAVAIFEMDSLLAQAPAGPLLPHITHHIMKTVGSLPPLVGLMGFSMGGLLAAHAAARWPHAEQRPPLIFLDTYAPRAMRDSAWRRLETRLSRTLLGRPNEQAADIEKIEPLSIRAHESVWKTLVAELIDTPVPRLDVNLHQIGAEEMVKYVGLLWRRATFGFSPNHFANWQTTILPGNHLELPHRLAGEVARHVAAVVACQNGE